jgi:hypothetical protein
VRRPIDKASDLAGEIGVEVLHEAGETLDIRHGEQEVIVVGEACKGVDSDGIEALGSG